MKAGQTLSSGILVRQDFRDSVRIAMFLTGEDIQQCATLGGTVFIVQFEGRYFGITCRHVLRGFNWRQLAITDQKFGRALAAISALYYPSEATGGAEGSDLLDIAVLAFADDVDATFFKDKAYIVDRDTICRSRTGDVLIVNGALKDPTTIAGDDIAAVFGLLEFHDSGPAKWDPTLRQGIAYFDTAAIKNLTGISGAPVFNQTQGKLCGVVVRGGIEGQRATMYYVEFSDVLKILEAIIKGTDRTAFEKDVEVPR